MIFEKFLGRKNEINKEEQKAFLELANKLIFTEPTDILLNTKNIDKLADKIKQEYLQIEFEFKVKQEKLVSGIPYILAKSTLAISEKLNAKPERREELEKQIEERKKERDSKPKQTFEKFIKEISEIKELSVEEIKKKVDEILRININGGIVDYGSWGFTPKLALLKQEKENKNLPKNKLNAFNYFINRNCLGVTTTIAAYLEKLNLKFDYGMSSNHPYIVLDLEDKKYLISNFGMKEFIGTIKEVDNFKILIRDTNKKEDDDEIILPNIIIFACDYNQGLIYEILENFEVLRQISLGKDVTNLPETYTKGVELAVEYKDVLQKTDWKKIQSKLFPDIYKYFLDNNELWKIENENTEMKHYRFVMERKLMEIFIKAQKETEYETLDFKEGQDKLKAEMKPYIENILEYILNDEKLSENIPENTQKFFESIKTQFEKVYNDNNKENPKELNFLNSILTEKLQDLAKREGIEK